MSKVSIIMRYKCSQCGEYFNGEEKIVDAKILNQPPIVVFHIYHQDLVHECYGEVPDGRQRFFGLGKVVGWNWRMCDVKPIQEV